jgi:hypothetical protein
VAAHRPHRELLERAGFTDIDETDCTSEFRAVTRAWIDQWELHRDDLVEMLGVERFEERQAERRTQQRAIEDGLLRRSLFVARRSQARAGAVSS